MPLLGSNIRTLIGYKVPVTSSQQYYFKNIQKPNRNSPVLFWAMALSRTLIQTLESTVQTMWKLHTWQMNISIQPTVYSKSTHLWKRALIHQWRKLYVQRHCSSCNAGKTQTATSPTILLLYLLMDNNLWGIKKHSTIWYDTRCYFNVRSKADKSQLNLPHGKVSKYEYLYIAE